MDGGTAAVILNVFALIEAGFDWMALQSKVKVLLAEGKTDEEVSAYLHNLRVATMAEGDEFFKVK